MESKIKSYLSKKIKIIIVTFNNADCIISCLQAIKREENELGLHITIMDNHSTDNTLSLVEKFDKEILIIRSLENFGYAYGNNIVLKEMFRERTRYDAVLILNPDVILNQGSISQLFEVLSYSPDVVAVSPYIFDSEISPIKISKMHTLWGMPMRKQFMDYLNIIEVDRLQGGCMLIKPMLFNKIGYFDEAFFLYWEEVDLCCRARKAGFKLLQCNTVKVSHFGHSLKGLERPYRIYYMWRNQIYFSFKSFGKFMGGLFLIKRICFNNFREAIVFLFSNKWYLIIVGLAGMFDGLMGKKGKSSRPFLKSSL